MLRKKTCIMYKGIEGRVEGPRQKTLKVMPSPLYPFKKWMVKVALQEIVDVLKHFARWKHGKV
jgi:hypothetical protein